MSDNCYAEEYYRAREAWPDFRLEVEALLGLARPAPGARVLDLGCGGGELLRRLDGRCRLAVGVDLSPAALRLARRSASGGVGNVQGVVAAQAETLPFADGSFDAILAQHLLEHLPNPAGALEEWRRVLRPEGLLALVTPNAAYRDPALFEDAGHVSLFTAPALRAALEDAGLRVIHLSTLFPYLGRGRLARAASLRLARPARRLPFLAGAGRSLVAAARLPTPAPPCRPGRR